MALRNHGVYKMVGNLAPANLSERNEKLYVRGSHKQLCLVHRAIPCTKQHIRKMYIYISQ